MKAIKSSNNFRELGGYQSLDGKSVVSDKLFRSGNLNSLSKEDWQYVQSLHIKDIVDLRSHEEKQEHPYVIAKGINYHDCVALHTKDGLENFYFFMLINKDSSSEQVKEASRFIREGYRILPFHNSAFKKVFDLMLTSEDGILFHCSSGKDRTGVLAALILKALNVDDEIIMQDYLISNEKVMRQTLKHAEELGFCEEVKDTLVYCCSVHEELLRTSWDEIKKKYNDWNTYFKEEYDLDELKIKQLRNKYLKKRSDDESTDY